jgi:hypothetical protein
MLEFVPYIVVNKTTACNIVVNLFEGTHILMQRASSSICVIFQASAAV